MTLHSHDAVIVSVAVATRSLTDSNIMEGHTSLSTALVYILPGHPFQLNVKKKKSLPLPWTYCFDAPGYGSCSNTNLVPLMIIGKENWKTRSTIKQELKESIDPRDAYTHSDGSIVRIVSGRIDTDATVNILKLFLIGTDKLKHRDSTWTDETSRYTS